MSIKHRSQDIGPSPQENYTIWHMRSVWPCFFKAFLRFSGEDDVKTLVWARTFCYFFSEMKTEVFENLLVWTWP